MYERLGTPEGLDGGLAPGEQEEAPKLLAWERRHGAAFTGRDGAEGPGLLLGRGMTPGKRRHPAHTSVHRPEGALEDKAAKVHTWRGCLAREDHLTLRGVSPSPDTKISVAKQTPNPVKTLLAED